MARKSLGLGRGLDSLFADAEQNTESVLEIPVGDLDPNPDQPRRTFNDETIGQLADSIREQGILQPLLVTATGGGRYRIIAGERRYRAARLAKLEKVPCLVKDIDTIHQMEIALIENLQREDLSPLEAARAVEALMNQCGYTQEKVGIRLGMSRSAVANLKRLLTLPEEVAAMVRDGELSQGHARAVAGVKDPKEAVRLARKAVRENLSVRELEKLAGENREGRTKKASSARKQLPAELEELQEKLLRKTGMRSALTGGIDEGRIVLHYTSRNELERLNEMLDLLGEDA